MILDNDRPEAAAFLASRGAGLTLEGAAGVGRLDVVMSHFNKDGSLKAGATEAQKQSGFVWACEYGYSDVVEFLLDKGIDLRAGENTGQTALHLAAHRGQSAIVKLLLKHGAALKARNVYAGAVLGQATWSVMNGDPISILCRLSSCFLPQVRTLRRRTIRPVTSPSMRFCADMAQMSNGVRLKSGRLSGQAPSRVEVGE